MPDYLTRFIFRAEGLEPEAVPPLPVSGVAAPSARPGKE